MLNNNVPKISYKDFLINQPEPSRDALEYVPFWLKHIEYCKSGVEVGGVYISGWLYWHINFFKLAIDEVDEYGNEVRVVKSPLLRDNEWFIDWTHQKATGDNNKPVIGFGTRRFGKTAYIASKISYKNFIFKNTHSVIMGGSAPDLSNITKYLDEFYEKRPDCFSDIVKIGDWSRNSSDVDFEFNRRKVTAGKNPINPISYEFFEELKNNKKDNSFSWSKVSVRNLEHGQVATKEEILAGITPSEGVWDEVGKYRYKLQRAALLPAITNARGKRRFVEFLIGTGGNIDFAVDAEKDFLYTEKSGFLHIDVDEYKEYVKPEHFQYVQDSDKKVSLFVPAQMSNYGGEKKEIPLYEYLNKDFTKKQKEELEGLNIFVTDWEKAEENVLKEIKDAEAKSREEGKKARMYMPFQPEDCFLFSGSNPFPVEKARKTQEKIYQEQNYGEFVDLETDSQGTIYITSSNKEPINEYPFKGGVHDAPIVIWERPIYDDPRMIKRGTYVAGFDGAKISTSATTDSVTTCYIYKRKAGVSGFQNQIVACVAGRPNREEIIFNQVMLLLKLYNAELLPEFDTNLLKYFRKHNCEYLIASAKGTNLRINEKSTASTEAGLPPTPRNQEHGMRLLQNQLWEEFPTGEVDDEGNPVMKLGVEFIPDPMLLEEIIKYGNYKNFDRIVTFYHALIWDEELTINGISGSADKAQLRKNVVDNILKKALGRNNKYRR